MNQEQWKQLVLKHFEQPMKAFLKEALVSELIPMAEKYVQESSNKIDDVVWAMAKEAILKGLEQV